MTDDRGLAALAERLSDVIPGEVMRAEALEHAAAILGPSGRFSPDGGLDVERLAEAARGIARLSEEDIRDYEQGLCFFCGAGHEPVAGPRGGLKGSRRQSPVHEPTCSYIALRAALATPKEEQG